MNYPTITILIGAPGSGKSSYARDVLKIQPHTVWLSRDELRKSMFGYTEDTIEEYYKNNTMRFGYHEKLITDEFESLLLRALINNKNVIADNTHAKASYINYYKRFPALLTIQQFGTPLDMCLKRDASRIRIVGETVIKKMYSDIESLDLVAINKSLDAHNTMMREFKIDPPSQDKPPVFVFDLDGTLAHATNRSPYDESKVMDDVPDLYVKFILDRIHVYTPNSIVIVSGRSEKCKEDTVKWLNINGIKHRAIFMREEGDHRPDWIVKQEIWKKLNEHYNIAMMFDDRDQVVLRARQLGIKCLQCEYGNF